MVSFNNNIKEIEHPMFSRPLIQQDFSTEPFCGVTMVIAGSQTCDNLNCSFENLAYASSSERATLEHLWEAYISVKDANELLESELHRARYERDAVLDR